MEEPNVCDCAQRRKRPRVLIKTKELGGTFDETTEERREKHDEKLNGSRGGKVKHGRRS